MKYLMVLPVAFAQLGNDVLVTESAFCEHLRQLMDSLSPELETLTIAAPPMDASTLEARQGHLGQLKDSRLCFVALNPEGCSRIAYWTRHLLGNIRKIWHAVGNATIVHAGPSHILWPRECIGALLAVLRRRRSIFVVDIDWRRSAWMNRKTGALSLKSYVLSKLFYDPMFSLQVRLAAQFCSLVMLKSDKLVRDYGRGKPNVVNILDAAHSVHHIINHTQLETRIQRVKERSPIRLVYFGRLVRYKGIDRMIGVISSIRDAGGPPITLDIIGGGDDYTRLNDLAHRLQVTDRVKFLGAVQFGSDLFSQLSNYDILLAMPMSADTPRSALDAMAAGLGLIAYDTDYYVDLANLSGAVALVPWLDDDKCAQAIIHLSQDRELLASMARKAVEFAKDNTQEQWLERRARWTRTLCRPGHPEIH